MMLQRILSTSQITSYKGLLSEAQTLSAKSKKLELLAKIYINNFCKLIMDTRYRELVDKHGFEDANLRFRNDVIKYGQAISFNTRDEEYYFRHTLSLKEDAFDRSGNRYGILKFKAKKMLSLIKDLKIFLNNSRYPLVFRGAISFYAIPYPKALLDESEIQIQLTHKRFLEKNFVEKVVIQKLNRS